MLSHLRELTADLGDPPRSYRLCVPGPPDQSADNILAEVARNEYPIAGLHLDCGDAILDVGAHVGIVAMVIASAYPGHMVHAIEPNPTLFTLLRENVTRNGCDNVRCHQLALTHEGAEHVLLLDRAVIAQLNIEKDGTALSVRNVNSGGSCVAEVSPRFAARNPDLPRRRARSMSFDEFARAEGISRVGLLKLDCEGSEHSMVPASRLIREGAVRNVVGEIHANATLGDGNALLRYLQRHVPGRVALLTTRIRD
jgi:FkbM family methyltransferase